MPYNPLARGSGGNGSVSAAPRTGAGARPLPSVGRAMFTPPPQSMRTAVRQPSSGLGSAGLATVSVRGLSAGASRQGPGAYAPPPPGAAGFSATTGRPPLPGAYAPAPPRSGPGILPAGPPAVSSSGSGSGTGTSSGATALGSLHMHTTYSTAAASPSTTTAASPAAPMPHLHATSAAAGANPSASVGAGTGAGAGAGPGAGSPSLASRVRRMRPVSASSMGVLSSLPVGHCSLQGMRPTMEDEVVVAQDVTAYTHLFAPQALARYTGVDTPTVVTASAPGVASVGGLPTMGPSTPPAAGVTAAVAGAVSVSSSSSSSSSSLPPVSAHRLCVFAVMDGHGGRDAARFCKTHLVAAIVAELERGTKSLAPLLPPGSSAAAAAAAAAASDWDVSGYHYNLFNQAAAPAGSAAAAGLMPPTSNPFAPHATVESALRHAVLRLDERYMLHRTSLAHPPPAAAPAGAGGGAGAAAGAGGWGGAGAGAGSFARTGYHGGAAGGTPAGLVSALAINAGFGPGVGGAARAHAARVDAQLLLQGVTATVSSSASAASPAAGAAGALPSQGQILAWAAASATAAANASGSTPTASGDNDDAALLLPAMPAPSRPAFPVDPSVVDPRRNNAGVGAGAGAGGLGSTSAFGRTRGGSGFGASIGPYGSTSGSNGSGGMAIALNTTESAGCTLCAVVVHPATGLVWTLNVGDTRSVLARRHDSAAMFAGAGAGRAAGARGAAGRRATGARAPGRSNHDGAGTASGAGGDFNSGSDGAGSGVSAAEALGVGCTLGVPMSRDHKCAASDEARRVCAHGGSVAVGRVNGQLAVTRAIGDCEFKVTVPGPYRAAVATALKQHASGAAAAAAAHRGLAAAHGGGSNGGYGGRRGSGSGSGSYGNLLAGLGGFGGGFGGGSASGGGGGGGGGGLYSSGSSSALFGGAALYGTVPPTNSLLAPVVFESGYTSLTAVAADPEISVSELSPDDMYIVLACDGLWDVTSSQAAAAAAAEVTAQCVAADVVDTLAPGSALAAAAGAAAAAAAAGASDGVVMPGSGVRGGTGGGGSGLNSLSDHGALLLSGGPRALVGVGLGVPAALSALHVDPHSALLQLAPLLTAAASPAPPGGAAGGPGSHAWSGCASNSHVLDTVSSELANRALRAGSADNISVVVVYVGDVARVNRARRQAWRSEPDALADAIASQSAYAAGGHGYGGQAHAGYGSGSAGAGSGSYGFAGASPSGLSLAAAGAVPVAASVAPPPQPIPVQVGRRGSSSGNTGSSDGGYRQAYSVLHGLDSAAPGQQGQSGSGGSGGSSGSGGGGSDYSSAYGRGTPPRAGGRRPSGVASAFSTPQRGSSVGPVVAAHGGVSHHGAAATHGHGHVHGELQGLSLRVGTGVSAGARAGAPGAVRASGSTAAAAVPRLRGIPSLNAAGATLNFKTVDGIPVPFSPPASLPGSHHR